MRIAFGADDQNECTQAVVEYLRSVAHVDVLESDKWPEFSREVAQISTVVPVRSTRSCRIGRANSGGVGAVPRTK